ncbi:MAG: methyl-accepting chemotaxis protein, partial [Acidovorax sp.]|nr:methyl-accepting chemotaxis protein [Acidovorax sp.]
TQMDQATQQNAALVEEMAAAASALNAQAGELVNAVAVFRLGAASQGHAGGGGSHRSAPQAVAAPAASRQTAARVPGAISKAQPATARVGHSSPASKPASAPASQGRSAAAQPAAADDKGDWESF